MNKSILAFALLLAAVPVGALAAGPATPATGAATPATATPVHHFRSRVHDVHGQRFDVPNSLMRNRDTMINGLAPQPAQFD